MRILVRIAYFLVTQLLMLLVVLAYEKLFNEAAEDARSIKPIRMRTLLLGYGLGLGVLFSLVNIHADGAMVGDLDRILSAFLTYGVGVPVCATIGFTLQRPFGLAGIGQGIGVIIALGGWASVFIRPLLAHFGHSYYVWGLMNP